MSGNRNAPTFWNNPEEMGRKLAMVLAGVMKGQQNNDFSVTLRGSPEITTEILVEFSRPGLVAVLAPSNAAAALDFSIGSTYAVAGQGKITVHHADGGSDREYGVVLQG